MADLGSIGLDVSIDLYESPILYVNVGVELPNTVSGTITDDNDDPAARTVRIYVRDTGVMVAETISDAGDGSYSAMAPMDEVQRIAMDDDAGDLYNDIIDRVIPG